MKVSPSALFAATLLPTFAGAYDIGCIYPPDMPEPFEARYAIHEYSGSYFMDAAIETPVVIHISSLSSLCQTNCIAYQDAEMNNAITKEPPLVRTPPEYHNSWSRMLCMAQCHEIVSIEAGRPEFMKPFWKKWGLTGLEPRKDIVGFAFLTSRDSGDSSSLELLLEKDDYHPFTVGQIVATEILLHVIDDGWNALGNFTYDLETGEEVECTANCEAYMDTTGYFPKNYQTGKRENATTKYVVEGNDMHWQPLTDTDMQGFFSDQQHVTPHIGFKAKTKLYDSVDDFPDAPDPEYDFRQEALEVVERLAETAGDDDKKQKVAFFDNKLLVINTVENEVKRHFADKYSFEDEVLYIEGMAAGEYEATLMAWRAKVKHDLVRPTTVIKRWGSDQLNTFSGDKGMDGPDTINARDFQAFQRVMPHSEYPSGSSCICTAYAEMTDAFTSHYYNETIKDIHFGKAGKGTGFGCDPTQDPPLFVAKGCEDAFTIPDMPTLLDMCSQSRLWAGFHFTAAVVEGEKMCAGVGLKAFEHMQKIRNGSTMGQVSYQGGPRPQCLSGEMAVGRQNEEGMEGSSAASSSTFMIAAALPLVAFYLGM